MYVVYHDSSGSHSSAIAAAIHLNWLPSDRIPFKDDLLNVPSFDKLEKRDQGRLIFHGKDEYDNQIYTIGCHHVPQIITNAISSVFQMIDRAPGEILCVDTSMTINQWMRIGGWSSRQLGFVALGRPLMVHGTLNAYPKIISIVKNTKLKVAP